MTKDELAHHIGARVRALRQSQGLTQSDLAGGELTKSFVSQVEAGKVTPSVYSLVLLAERLQVPPAHFFEDVDVPDLGTVPTQSLLDELARRVR